MNLTRRYAMYKILLGDMLAISTKAYPKKDAVVFYEADGERKRNMNKKRGKK